MTFQILAAASIGYLIGSIPFGLILTRIAGHGDIRKVGSGNIGATNVLRTGNKTLAFITLALDIGKGAASASAVIVLLDFNTGLITGFFAVIGHNFPLWLKFRGGKGVATTLGVIFIASWQVAITTCGVWLLIAGITRYSSLAALGAFAASPIFAAYFANRPVSVVVTCFAGLVFVRHWENILRLIRGKETRIGQNQPVHGPKKKDKDLSI